MADLAGRTYVSLDLETTGLTPESDAIIEIGAVRFREGRRIEAFESLVNPHRPIPYRVQSLCRISQRDVESAPSFSALIEELRSFVGNDPIVGHNISFDLSFLARSGMALSNPAYDTLDLTKLLLPTLPERNLSAVAAHLGVSNPSAHRALADAEVVKDVFSILLERLCRLDPAILGEMVRLARRADWWVGSFLGAIARERGSDSLFARAAFENARFALPVEPMGEPLKPGEEMVPLDVEALAGMFDADGLLAGAFPNYEPRPQQIAMMRAVSEAFNSSRHLIVEAGTGVGKSVAYLLPAMVFARQNSVPVVVSTNTIALQEQLVGKDIPLLLDALGADLKVAQVKGRTNYLCLRRWDTQRRVENLPTEAAQLLARIQMWLPSTLTGDRSELNIDGREAPYWHRVAAQSYDCLGKKCAYHQRGFCFLYRAREAAHRAHLIVVNHALLLSEIASGAQILPEYGRLVIDEAHHLEGVATDQLGTEVREQDVFDLLDQMLSDAADGRGGLIPQLDYLVRASDSPSRGDLERLNAELASAVTRARSRVSDFFNEMGYFIQSFTSGEGEYDLSLRVTRAIRTQPGWSDIELSCENVTAALDSIGRPLGKIISTVQDLPIPDPVKMELVSLLNNTEETKRRIDSLVFHRDENAVHWLAQARKTNRITLNSAPLHVGSLLESALYAQKETLVLTSATLSTEGNFNYLKGRLGIEDAEELLVGSPFDYKRAALVYLATDIPEPGRVGYQETLARVLIRLCRASEGRSLVLFTSHAALRATQAAIQGPLEEDDILVLGQGLDGTPRKLISHLKENPRTVLLGAASFWEGVDIVGDALSLVVIVRLPFSVPTDPVFAARSETFKNPFAEYALPQAAFKFKQGFGRLIRSKTDRGAMAVLDSRIINKGYASIFMNSLPRCRVERGPCGELPEAVKEWLAKSP